MGPLLVVVLLLNPLYELLILYSVILFSCLVRQQEYTSPLSTFGVNNFIIWLAIIVTIDDLSQNISYVIYFFTVIGQYIFIYDADGVTPENCILFAL